MSESASYHTPPPPSSLGMKQFFSAFFNSKGTIAALVLSTVLSFGMGSTVGVLPEILSDRFARLYYDYDGPGCWSLDHDSMLMMPEACRQGSDDAQAASAWGSLLLNTLTLFCNPVIGSFSDVHGRRPAIILSIFLFTLGPTALLVLQLVPVVSPWWYYIANSLTGIVHYLSITFAAVSDTVPEQFRAPSFALIVAGFYGGFALAPSFALILNHFMVSLLSLVLTLICLSLSILILPETLPEDVSTRNRQSNETENVLLPQDGDDYGTSNKFCMQVLDVLKRPFREIHILNRDTVVRLVAIGSFFSSMIFSTDSTLVVFYIESHFNVRDDDIAKMFVIMGTVGIILQAFLLQPLVKCLGEKGLLVASFSSGVVHNLLYGIARQKRGIYIALILSQFTKTSYPVLSSVASRGASVDEQGQLQGALFALNAMGSALGPVSMQFVYNQTKNNLGPGTMFVFAAMIYFLGAIAVSLIPRRDETTTDSSEDEITCNNDMEEPLLTPDCDETLTSS